MGLYQHTEGGEVTETVQTVPGSYNDRVLAEKAKDSGSGWAAVDERQPDRPNVQTVGAAPVGEQAPAGEQVDGIGSPAKNTPKGGAK